LDANALRLAAVLEEDLRAGRPDLRITGSDYADGVVAIRHAVDPGINPYDRYGATLQLEDRAGAGTLMFQALPGRPLTPLWSPNTALARRWLVSCEQYRGVLSRDGRQCSDNDGPDGQRIVVVTELLVDGLVRHQAFVGWPDAQVSVAVWNSEASVAAPLTPTQLVALASDPRLAPR